MAVQTFGPEAAAVSVANILTTYLNAKLDAQTAAWNDGTPLPHPKAVYAYEAEVTPQVPLVMVYNALGKLTADMSTVYHELEHVVAVHWIVGSNRKETVEKQKLRYLWAIWQTLAEHQRGDGTAAGQVSISLGEYQLTSPVKPEKSTMLLAEGYIVATVRAEEMLQ